MAAEFGREMRVVLLPSLSPPSPPPFRASLHPGQRPGWEGTSSHVHPHVHAEDACVAWQL